MPLLAALLLSGPLSGCGSQPSADGDGDADSDAGDGDGDGFLDVEETECGSDPEDPASTCYRCGWRRGDPGDLVATGAAVGDTIDNATLVDQCGDEVPLWDFAGEYHVLFLTAAW
jgi:hypothetical protein